MKRIFVLLAAVCLVLSACGAPAEPTPTTQPTTQATTEATTVPTTVPTEPPVLYRNPLNGTPLDAPYTGRITTVVINNLKGALPHHGVSQADFLYELEVEGDITRCLAVFTDLEGVEKLGPVRSTRTFFNNITLSYDGVIMHCGGSKRGRNAYADRDSGKITDWAHIDQVYNDPYFYRDTDRYAQGYALEHTLFTTGERLLNGLEAKGLNVEQVRDFGLQFHEEVNLNSFIANSVKVTFRNSKTTSFTYNETTGLYDAAQYGSDYIDANTGEQMAFRNLIVLFTDQSFRHDGEYSRSYYVLEGEGEGYLAINGQIAKIKWSRADWNSPFVYTFEDGTPVTLGVGTTYVAVTCDERGAVDYE